MKKVAKILLSISFLFGFLLSNLELAEAKGSSSSRSSSSSSRSSSSSSSSYSKPSTSTTTKSTTPSTTTKSTTPSTTTKSTTPSTTTKSTTPSTTTKSTTPNTTVKKKLISNPKFNKSNVIRSTNYGSHPKRIKVSNSTTNMLLFYLIFFGNDDDGNAVYANENETEFYSYDEITEAEDVVIAEEYEKETTTESKKTDVTKEVIDEVGDLTEEMIEEDEYIKENYEGEDKFSFFKVLIFALSTFIIIFVLIRLFKRKK